MDSWFLAVLFVALGLPFVRVRAGNRALGLVKAATVTGTLCYLFGFFQVFFAFPAKACPDFRGSSSTVHLDSYTSGLLPPHATCRWEDGSTKDILTVWVNPLLFTCAAVLIGCSVTLAVRARRRNRKGRTR